MEFQEITAEDDRVVIVAKGKLPLKDGRTYRNNFLLHMRAGKTASANAFLDAIHVNEICALGLNDTRHRRPTKGAPTHVLSPTSNSPA
jgi:hypothetical protein